MKYHGACTTVQRNAANVSQPNFQQRIGKAHLLMSEMDSLSGEKWKVRHLSQESAWPSRR